jgi:Tfp pilus assembly protein PilV
MTYGASPSPASPARSTVRRSDDAGFTMIEVLVAATLLIIGVFATLALVDRGAAATSSSLQRDRGNALAREIVERATGMRQVRSTSDSTGAITDVNELVGLAPTGSTVRPEAEVAERLRSALDPDGDGASSTVSLQAVANRYVQRSTWQTTRSGTRYTVTYRACTTSDRIQGIVIQGDLDCNRVAPNQQNPPTGPLIPGVGGAAAQCGLALAAGTTLPVSTTAAVNDITVGLQLLNVVNASTCVNGLLSALGLGGVVDPLCSALGPVGPTVAGTLSGVTGLLGSLGANAAIGLCPKADVASQAVDVSSGIATATRVETTVSWFDQARNKTVTVRQTSAARRGTATTT